MTRPTPRTMTPVKRRSPSEKGAWEVWTVRTDPLTDLAAASVDSAASRRTSRSPLGPAPLVLLSGPWQDAGFHRELRRQRRIRRVRWTEGKGARWRLTGGERGGNGSEG